MSDDTLNFGACCGCKTTTGVRNLVLLNRRAPIAGKGWSCLQCNLPADGAVSVLCDACAKRYTMEAAPPEVCVGYPMENKRVASSTLSAEEFDHDLSKHRACVN